MGLWESYATMSRDDGRVIFVGKFPILTTSLLQGLLRAQRRSRSKSGFWILLGVVGHVAAGAQVSMGAFRPGRAMAASI